MEERIIRFLSIHGRWVTVSEKRAYELAKKLYQLSHDEYKLSLVNKRFYGIKFTEEELKK